MSTGDHEAKEMIVQITNEMFQLGMLTCTGGNVSAKSDDGETILALLALGHHLEISEADYTGAEAAYREGLDLATEVGGQPVHERVGCAQVDEHGPPSGPATQHAAGEAAPVGAPSQDAVQKQHPVRGWVVTCEQLVGEGHHGDGSAARRTRSRHTHENACTPLHT